MGNKKFWLGILVMTIVLLLGMTVVGVEAQSNNGGEFTLINIPSKYNGKYAFLYGDDGEAILLLGGASINPLKPSRIIDGKVILPMWFSRDGKRYARYSGNHANFDITIVIMESDTAIVDLDEGPWEEDIIDTINFTETRARNSSREIDKRVKFSNGNVTKSWNDKS
jgi:hypothetical protein